MASRPAFSVQCSLPNGQNVSSSEVDAWELKVARRALQNIKTLIEGPAMLELLSKQIEKGDAYYKDLIAKSNGEFKEARMDFSVKGMKASQFLDWFLGLAAKETPEGIRRMFLDVMAPAHPEHYSLGPYPLGVVETIGEHICRVRIDPVVEVPDFVRKYGDPAFEHKLPVTCYLDDGTLFFYGFQEIRDTNDGCDFRIRIIFPAASPQILFDEHTEHLAIEFRSWIVAAFDSHHT